MQEARRRQGRRGLPVDTKEVRTPDVPAPSSRNYAARFGFAGVVIALMVSYQWWSGMSSTHLSEWRTSKMLEQGHWDFGDGRRTMVDKVYLEPRNAMLYYVNVMLGNGGSEPNLSGGMIPSVAPPFAMTRWTPQTRQNYVSMCPYNQTDIKIHGFIGTHQPAIWMGESGPVQLAAGLGSVVTDFDARSLPFDKADEYASINYYENILRSQDGIIKAQMTASSRVGHLRFTFDSTSGQAPHIVIDASRESVITSDPANVTYPLGHVTIDRERREIFGWNSERQDHILISEELPAPSYKGYFVARFSKPFANVGISRHGKLHPAMTDSTGTVISGYASFDPSTTEIDVRVGHSFISIAQARRNLDLEIPAGQSLEDTSKKTRAAWADKFKSLEVEGATPSNLTVLCTGIAHTLVYPNEQHEIAPSGLNHYYSGYTDKVETGVSYTGYSIWDTFRAETAWLIFLAPERVPEMITSMLQDYKQGGWLPMWKNIVETNIMIATNADSIIAQAMRAGITGFDEQLAWEAVRKDATVAPDRDTELRFDDREEHTPQEARAGLTEYKRLGYVADDLHSEAGSRTLDYAYNDWATAIVAEHVGATTEADFFRQRSKTYSSLWNNATGFMESRRSDSSWAGEEAGWCEGDHWAYSFDVMHDVPGLAELMGGNDRLISFLDRHFDQGHNLHTNEPSHHIPYMYAMAGAPSKTQERVLQLAQSEYNHTADGLSGNEDCGQMSAWYIFSAMGFYPVDPASAEYVVGVPLFERFSIHLPNAKRPLAITAKGVTKGRRYIASVQIDGKPLLVPLIRHSQISNGAEIEFTMSAKPTAWGSSV